MPSPYLISALVSVYNSRKFIAGCLDDLIAQSLYQQDRLEVIVVNTDSPGKEDALIRQYVEHFPHFVYVHVPERETVYAAWNRGIVLSQASFLTSASTDDRHRPDALLLAGEMLERERLADPRVALACYPSYLHTKPNQVWSDNLQYERLYTGKEDVEGFADGEIGPNPVWWKGLHRAWGLFDATFQAAADHDFYSKKVQQEFRFKRYPEPLGLWYRDKRGQSNLGYLSEQELERIEDQPAKPTPEAVEAEWKTWEDKNQSVEILRSTIPAYRPDCALPAPKSFWSRLFGA